ncbi:energy-coupled thiamine transporter ThiT, partial [Klebsiella pneumoniae]|uniref:energy-coupled thiamine transporter ThiT n=1 Tax=Klebsiella pneumoniae TaxID=573 RepID=UPI0025A10927
RLTSFRSPEQKNFPRFCHLLPPTQTLLNFFLVIFLDYILAFGVLGLGGIFSKKENPSPFTAALGAFFVTALRYLCHILSG